VPFSFGIAFFLSGCQIWLHAPDTSSKGTRGSGIGKDLGFAGIVKVIIGKVFKSYQLVRPDHCMTTSEVSKQKEKDG